jgi:hypothetical protein
VLVVVTWNDVRRGAVELPYGGWKQLRVAVGGPGVLRLLPERTFPPLSRTDRRRLGIETGTVVVGP